MAIYYALKNGRVRTENIWIFASAFLSTLINFLSPGYRVRENVESDQERTLLYGIKLTFQAFKDNTDFLFLKKNYIIIALVLLFCGALLVGKIEINKRGYLIMTVLSLALPIITIFPVVYGYNVSWMPNRCVFVTIFIMDIVYGNIALVLGYMIRTLLKSSYTRAGRVVFACVFIVAFITSPYSPLEYTVAKMNKQLFDHQYQDYYTETRSLLESLENHKGEDMAVDVCTYPEEVRNFYAFFLDDNPETRTNSTVAWCYGLKSIVNTRHK